MNPTTTRPTLRLKRLRDDAAVPAYQTAGAAGLDLCAACGTESIELAPGQRARVPTGWAVALPAGHEGQIRPRSGLAAKHGITVANAPGTIDEDYRGELQVLLVNLGSQPFVISSGDRIAQLVVAPVTHVAVELASRLEATERGDGGFGSTG